MSEYVSLLPLVEVSEKQAVEVTFGGKELIVCRTGDSVHVFDNLCPHQNQPLTRGRVRNGFLFCPFHGMRFRLENGEALGQLCNTPLKKYDARVEDGQVQVSGIV